MYKKKKLTDFSQLGAFVFSTNEDAHFENVTYQETLPPSKQNLQAIFSNKGRGGKVVTIIRGFVGTDEDLKTLGKDLKIQCGVGGSVKDGEMIIQGNCRDKVIKILEKQGFKIKKVGG